VASSASGSIPNPSPFTLPATWPSWPSANTQ
jgi:hypothetical protein